MTGFISCSDAEYHLLPGVSPTSARNMLVSPLAYKASLSARRDPSDEMQLGSAVHVAALEPEKFSKKVVEYCGTRSGKSWAQFAEDNADSIILPRLYYERAIGCMKGLANHAKARTVLESLSSTEVAIGWVSENGLNCRGRIDGIGNRIIDIKTAADISDNAIIRSTVDLAYHMQLAAYRDGYRRVAGQQLDCVLIFVQTRPPYDVRVMSVTGDEIEYGALLWERCLNRIKECEMSGHWPGIEPDEKPLILPEWAMRDGFSELSLDGETV